MGEHYTSDTEEVLMYCPTCGRNTTHAVMAGRLAYCSEHGLPRYSKKQLADLARREREETNPRLF